MKEKKMGFYPNVGASSLLVTFGFLCLVVFAVLSVATVQADQRLGDELKGAVLAYYDADCRAEEILAKLRFGEMPLGVIKEENRYCYRCKISDTQVLMVEVEIEGDGYRVLRWQTVTDTQWQPDEKLPVWNGEE